MGDSWPTIVGGYTITTQWICFFDDNNVNLIDIVLSEGYFLTKNNPNFRTYWLGAMLSVNSL